MSSQDDRTRLIWNLEVPPNTSVSIEPATKHDGNLPAGSELSVDGEVRWAGSFISIQCGPSIVMLDRKQGDLLLSWLQQQQAKGKLEELAKE